MTSRRDEELLERLDAHIARMDEQLRLSEAAHRRSEAAHRRSEERFELNRLAFERTFLGMDALVRTVEDMGQEIKASTQAVLKLLDRFDNGGQTA